jgi:hypothetical protein
MTVDEELAVPVGRNLGDEYAGPSRGRGACFSRAPAHTQEVTSMIAPLMDSVTGTAVYVNPEYVVTLRPEPGDPLHVTLIKLQDGESIRVRGEHTEVAEKLARRA